MISENDDSLLWENFRNGDKAAFQAIYQKYVPALLNYGQRISSDASINEDSVQDLFIELWKSGKNLSSTTSVKFYLFKALRYKILRNQNAGHYEDAVSIDGYMTIMKEPSEEDNLIQFETDSFQLQRLKASIEKLPQRQREAINLRYFHNFSNEQISEIMGVNYQSACKFIYAALKTLKEYLRVAVSLLIAMLAYI